MAIPMKSLRTHVYAGKRFKPGDPFEARGEGDKRVLVAIKAAEVATAPAVEPAAAEMAWQAGYGHKDLAAETSTQQDDGVPAVRIKRAYRRRDLVAE